jgi:hypothetical protein
MRLKVKTETLANRCDICHQNDFYNPDTNQCSRCVEIQEILNNNINPNNVKIFPHWTKLISWGLIGAILGTTLGESALTGLCLSLMLCLCQLTWKDLIRYSLGIMWIVMWVFLLGYAFYPIPYGFQIGGVIGFIIGLVMVLKLNKEVSRYLKNS